MKQYIIGLISLVLCLSVNAATLVIPDTVQVVRSVSFSVGGADDAFKVVTILCDMHAGYQQVFVINKFSVAGLFGVNRWCLPTDFKIEKRHGYTEAKWED